MARKSLPTADDAVRDAAIGASVFRTLMAEGIEITSAVTLATLFMTRLGTSSLSHISATDSIRCSEITAKNYLALVAEGVPDHKALAMAAAYLWGLLSRDDEPRDPWEQEAEEDKGGEP